MDYYELILRWNDKIVLHGRMTGVIGYHVIKDYMLRNFTHTGRFGKNSPVEACVPTLDEIMTLEHGGRALFNSYEDKTGKGAWQIARKGTK